MHQSRGLGPNPGHAGLEGDAEGLPGGREVLRAREAEHAGQEQVPARPGPARTDHGCYPQSRVNSWVGNL